MTSALSRGRLYDYLARVFDGCLDDLPEPPDDCPTVLSIDVATLCTAIAHSSLDDVLADHTRLFITALDGVAAPPYASWYLDRQLQGPASDWVSRAYAAQGIETTADGGEPPDYIGAELEFMYFLARHEHAARITDDVDALRAVVKSEAEFVSGHLARWLPLFIAGIRAANPGPVFAAASSVLQRVLRDDARRLSGCRCNSLASTIHA